MQEEIRTVLLQIPPIFGIDMSITTDVLLVWMAGLTTFIVVLFACRRTGSCARGAYQNLFEALIEFVNKEVVNDTIGPNGKGWAPFVLTIFFFVLFCNLFGQVPIPSLFKPLTSNLSVTSGLAVMVFVVSQVADIRLHGVTGFLKRVVPPGVPMFISPFLFLLELVTRIARPVSLTLRLFTNMLAGHVLQLAIISLGVSCYWFLAPLPYLGVIAMNAFELLVCFVQAFIFTILTGFYLREAVEESH